MPQLTPNPKQIAARRAARSIAPARRMPATRDEAAAAVERLALLRCGLAERMARLDSDIAILKAQAAADSEDMVAEAEALEGTVRLFCEAHRFALTDDGRTKTVAFGSGQVSWRQRPASIAIDDEARAIASLRANGLAHCIRTVSSVDKQALMRAGLGDLSTVDGLRLVAGTEDCIIKTSLSGASDAHPHPRLSEG